MLFRHRMSQHHLRSGHVLRGGTFAATLEQATRKCLLLTCSNASIETSRIDAPPSSTSCMHVTSPMSTSILHIAVEHEQTTKPPDDTIASDVLYCAEANRCLHAFAKCVQIHTDSSSPRHLKNLSTSFAFTCSYYLAQSHMTDASCASSFLPQSLQHCRHLASVEPAISSIAAIPRITVPHGIPPGIEA